jgi:hypothetical protein
LRPPSASPAALSVFDPTFTRPPPPHPNPQCPVCAQSVNLVHGEDANDTWARHAASGACDPAKRAAARRPKCAVAGCRERLALTNKYTCSSCRKDVCMR